jgi:XisH protein
MPARDIYHNAVKTALIADGWTVTHDPYRIEYGGKDAYIDLGAEREIADVVLAAERGATRIAIEIKTFTGPSVLADLQQALGQYLLYRSWMRRIEPERMLYLAVDTETAMGVFDAAFGQIVADEAQIRLVVVDMLMERIVAWRQFPATDK